MFKMFTDERGKTAFIDITQVVTVSDNSRCTTESRTRISLKNGEFITVIGNVFEIVAELKLDVCDMEI